MSVKLVSWSDPLKLTPVPVDLVERNAKILKNLYQSAGVSFAATDGMDVSS